jgi:hypothetical protein
VIDGASSAREASELLIDRARAMGNGDGDNISLAILKLIDAPPAISGAAVQPVHSRPSPPSKAATARRRLCGCSARPGVFVGSPSTAAAIGCGSALS